MTPEQLLLPRVEIVALIPYTGHKVGDILYPDEDAEVFIELNNHHEHYVYIHTYPHLFRKMHWAEQREVSDLPDYVKHVEKSFIGKHIKDESRNYGWFTIESDMIETILSSLQNFIEYLPATKEEYEQYLISNTKI